jgi:uncharacterized protein (TIGR02996 family)
MTLKAILRECVESPEDDGPRLVLADWLDDHGDADRAEFVRGQVALARMAEYDPARHALETRLEQLQRRHFAAWVASLPVPSWGLNRGLLHVSVSAEELPSLQTDAEEWDWVERVTLSDTWAPEPLSALGSSGLLSRPISLAADESGLKLAGARALAGCPGLANLLGLSLARNNIGDKGAAVLANSPFLANLRSLNLSYNRIGVAGAQALASSPHLAGLISLSLDYNSAGAASAALLASPHLTRLESLSMISPDGGRPKGLGALRADRPASLKQLNLAGVNLGQSGTAALAASPLVAKLTSLDLSGTCINPQAMRALASSPHLANLTVLKLSYNAPGDEGARALIRSPYLTNLKELHLFQWAEENFTAAGARELADWPGLAQLTHLFVNLDDEGAAALASSPYVSGLRDLSLFNSSLGDKGAQALAKSRHLRGLLRLNLRTTGIGETGALAIAKSEPLASLRCLVMTEDQVGKVGSAALRKRFGDRVIL